MPATPQSIWQIPAYLPYLQAPLTAAAVAEAEKSIGFRLPQKYLDLLKVQNGGYIRYRLPDNVHSMIAGIGPNFPSLTEFDWEGCHELVSFKLPGLVPFDGDGHWHLCLDYRENSDSPSISYIDVETDNESPIAASFAEYLSLLRVECGDDYVVENPPAIDDGKAVISTALGVVFEAPDYQDYGYPVHRAVLRIRKMPEWILITTNTAPRGFVRPDDERYNELKDLLPGVASRYAEVPATALILTATDGLRAKVLQTCANSGLHLRPLGDYLKTA